MAKSKTYIKYVKNLTPDEYRECERKNFGAGGLMRDDLRMHKRQATDAKVVLIKDETKHVMAWALIQPQSRKGKASVMLWVVPKYRRQGLGARLVYHARKIDEKPRVFPHDSTSGNFFKKIGGVRVANHERFWMR